MSELQNKIDAGVEQAREGLVVPYRPELELLDYLAEEAPTDEVRDEHDESANKKLRRLQALEVERQRIIDQANAEIERINVWRDSRLNAIRDTTEFLEARLTDYHRALKDRGIAGQTYPLPAGELKARKVSASVDVQDENAFMDWAVKNDAVDLITTRVKRSVDKKSLKEMNTTPDGDFITTNGEVVPGVKVIAPHEQFSVKLAPVES